MKHLKHSLVLIFALGAMSMVAQTSKNPLIQKGWAALVRDQEDEAFGYFWKANAQAQQQHQLPDLAESYLYLGICSYGSSLEKGLRYVTLSLDTYHQLESKDKPLATVGRNKCLQLISTIYSRQHKYDAAMRLSKEVVASLETTADDSGTLGLAYNSLASIYDQQNQEAEAERYYRLALASFIKTNNTAYLPISYCKIGTLLQKKQDKEGSLRYFEKALALATTTKNKQAQVKALNAMGGWHRAFGRDLAQAEAQYRSALTIAKGLQDKTFEITILESLIALQKEKGAYAAVSQLQDTIIALKDRFYSTERQQIEKHLEVQFEVSEQNRKLKLISAQEEVSRLTNYLLASLLALLVIVFTILYLFLKRINKRDKQLLRTKEALVALMEEQKVLKEQQFQIDLDHKESQLSAITIQILEKNQLLEEIKTILSKKEPTTETELKKLVSKYTIQDHNWKDFDQHFERVNKHFYTRLKQNYPEISANDLKICALIKLNLSIKEMASILNISPDSVKTARHRLRKKLQLSTEDNLTDFILSI
jgi:DNA-binding CsgD family transcriptional regulator